MKIIISVSTDIARINRKIKTLTSLVKQHTASEGYSTNTCLKQQVAKHRKNLKELRASLVDDSSAPLAGSAPIDKKVPKRAQAPLAGSAHIDATIAKGKQAPLAGSAHIDATIAKGKQAPLAGKAKTTNGSAAPLAGSAKTTNKSKAPLAGSAKIDIVVTKPNKRR